MTHAGWVERIGPGQNGLMTAPGSGNGSARTTEPTGWRAAFAVVTLRRVVISLLLAVAVGGFVVAANLHVDAPTTPPRDRAITTVYPAPGALVERQTQVFYELDSSYDGVLQINGVEIPEDQVERLSVGQTRIGFTPGPGKEISRFPPSRNCATALFWHRDQTRAAARMYSWCFNLG